MLFTSCTMTNIYLVVDGPNTFGGFGLKWLVFYIGPLDLIGMWFSEDQRANIIKTHV